MKQSTHAVIGLWAGLALSFSVNAEPIMTAVLVCSGVIGAVAPDIDSRGSVIRHANYNLYRAMEFAPMRHRGWTHTALVALLLSALAWYAQPLVAVPFIIGYWSHLLLDMMTRSGVRLLRPFWNRPLFVLVKKWRFLVGSPKESLLALVFWALFLIDTYRWLWSRGVLP